MKRGDIKKKATHSLFFSHTKTNKQAERDKVRRNFSEASSLFIRADGPNISLETSSSLNCELQRGLPTRRPRRWAEPDGETEREITMEESGRKVEKPRQSGEKSRGDGEKREN